MISLIRNEWMKIFSRVSTYMYFGVMVIAVIGVAFLYNMSENQTDKSWEENSKAEISSSKEMLKDNSLTEESKKEIQLSIERNQQQLEEGINPNKTTNWSFMVEGVASLTSFITLFVVIVCSATVSAEFSDGTIKQLLIRPHKRWKILLSKYITSMLFAILLLVVLMIVGYITSLVAFDHSAFSDKSIDAFGNGVTYVLGERFVEEIIYWIPGFLVVSMLAFMLSTLFKNQAIAVGISVFVLFASSTLNIIIQSLANDYEWLKFILFPHLNMRLYLGEGMPMFAGATELFSLCLLSIYYAIFAALTFFSFQKRDVSI